MTHLKKLHHRKLDGGHSVKQFQVIFVETSMSTDTKTATFLFIGWYQVLKLNTEVNFNFQKESHLQKHQL